MDGITKDSIKTAKLIKQLWPQLTDKEAFDEVKKYTNGKNTAIFTEVEGDTLYIVAKSGTKGAESLMDALAAFGIVPEVHVVQTNEEPETTKEVTRTRVEFKNGQLVEVKGFDGASLEDRIRQYRASKVKPVVDTKEVTKELDTIFESQKQLSECVEELIYLRRSNNSTYALACTLRGSGQGVMPYVGDKLEKFSVEGLYVSGALDTKYTTIGRDVFGKLPNFKHVIVEGAGHNVHIEKPQIFEQAVLDFLQKKG